MILATFNLNIIKVECCVEDPMTVYSALFSDMASAMMHIIPGTS